MIVVEETENTTVTEIHTDSELQPDNPHKTIDDATSGDIKQNLSLSNEIVSSKNSTHITITSAEISSDYPATAGSIKASKKEAGDKKSKPTLNKAAMRALPKFIRTGNNVDLENENRQLRDKLAKARKALADGEAIFSVLYQNVKELKELTERHKSVDSSVILEILGQKKNEPEKGGIFTRTGKIYVSTTGTREKDSGNEMKISEKAEPNSKYIANQDSPRNRSYKSFSKNYKALATSTFVNQASTEKGVEQNRNKSSTPQSSMNKNIVSFSDTENDSPLNEDIAVKVRENLRKAKTPDQLKLAIDEAKAAGLIHEIGLGERALVKLLADNHQ